MAITQEKFLLWLDVAICEDADAMLPVNHDDLQEKNIPE